MDLLIDETLAVKRRSEWDNLLARLSTYTDTSDIPISEIEKVYGKKENAHFTSVKHGFRKRLVNRKRQTRQRKLAFEVRNSDDDGSGIELLSYDSSIYSENDELESDISDSDSVDSVQYVLQCNEQRKLPDFNAKVENCQTYLLQNACFNQSSVKENSASVYINNSSVQKKSLDNEVSDICEDKLLWFLEPNSTCFNPIKSTLENKETDDDRIINPFEDEVILTIDKSQISNSENKQLKSILQTNISENSLKIHKKLTVSSASDSEIDIQKNDVSNNSIQKNDKETDNVRSENSHLSTLQSTKTLATNNKTEGKQKENRLPKENTTTKKNKDTEKRKTRKKIGTRIFSTDIDCSVSELNVILKSIANVPVINNAENTVNKDNVIKKNKTQHVTTDVAEMKKKYLISSTPNVRGLKNKSRKGQSLKENNKDDAITELVSCDQSAIINEEHVNDITKINIQKNIDENSSEEEKKTDILEIFETTIVNKEPRNISERKNGEYTNNKTNNTLVNENYEDNETTISETIVNKENKNEEKRLHNRNGQKIITNSRNNCILDTSSENEVVRPLIKSSRKKKSREIIHKSPVKSNSDNQSSKIVKCRQRLFNSSSEYDEENVNKSIIKSGILIKNSLKIKCIQDEVNADKENSKNNETHLLTETSDIISNKIQNKSVSFSLENNKKRKLRDSNCGPVKQMEKKHKTIINNTNRNSTKQVTLNGMLEKLKIEQKSVLKTIENNIEHEKESSINTSVNENVRQRTSQEIVLKQTLFNEVSTNNSQLVNSINNDSSQSIKDEQCNLSGMEKVKKKRRRKSRKEIRFIQYSTDDYTNDTDKSLSISTKTNLTPLSLEYFLDDDVF